MKQVMLLGDSIRMQYQKAVGEKLADLAEVCGPEENGRWSGYTLNSLRFWLPKMPVPDLVHWNCGLWDMGDDYQEGRHFYPPDLYEETCHRTTTPTMQGDHADILMYNDILKKVASEEHAVINDLYSVVAPCKQQMIGEDHVHLTEAGIAATEEKTAAVIRQLLI